MMLRVLRRAVTQTQKRRDEDAGAKDARIQHKGASTQHKHMK